MNKDFFNNLKGTMKTAKAILSFCIKHRAEFLPLGKNYVLTVARKLDEAAEAEFRALVPDREVTFIESPKIQTRINLENILSRTRPQQASISEPDIEHRSVTVNMEGVPESDPAWGEISDVLRKDGFFDSWKFVIDGQEHEVIAKMIDEVAKNKEGHRRNIGDDDITDLKISLANAQTVDDILKAMGS